MARRDKLLQRFDKALAFRRTALSARLGAAVTEDVLREAREQYESLVEDIPYAGRDRDIMAINIIIPAELLAFVLVLRRRGHSREEIGTLISELVEIPFQRLPIWLVRPFLRLSLPLVRWWMRRQARASQERQHPDEFIWEVTAGDGTTDLGINIRSCAVCKTFAKHDAMDVVPYVCALDDRVSRTFDLGLRRSGTIALGASHCDFRWKLGGEPRTLGSQFELPLIDRGKAQE
jgi:hypothetical protein